MRDFADFDYLRLRCGSRSVKVKGDHCFARDGRRVFVSDPQVEIPLEEYLSMIEECEKHAEPPSFYMGKVPLKQELPELVEDIESAPVSPLKKYGSCFGPNPRGAYTYFGCGRNSTATHFDPSENLLMVISGKKRFMLFPPTDVDSLYPTHAPQYTNSGVPPVASTSEPLSSKILEHYPLYKHASVMQVDLEAGDMLYLPIFWWHQVSGSDERNMILNWWCDLHPQKKVVSPETEGARALIQRMRNTLAA